MMSNNILYNLNGPTKHDALWMVLSIILVLSATLSMEFAHGASFTATPSDTLSLSTKANSPQKVSSQVALADKEFQDRSLKSTLSLSESTSMPQKQVSSPVALADKVFQDRSLKSTLSLSASTSMPQKQVSSPVALADKASTSKPVKDVVSLIDLPNAVKTIVISFLDSVTSSDQVATLRSAMVFLIDSVTSSDQVATLKSILVFLQDSV